MAMGEAMPRRGEVNAVLEFTAPGGYGFNAVTNLTVTVEAKRLLGRGEATVSEAATMAIPGA